MPFPKVSVIISTYNSEQFIRGKIDDLINQSIFNQLEIIIVNSGSEQNEKEIIIPYLSKYPNIKYIHTSERETIYKAWNRGIKIARGKYITNSNTDDRLSKNALEILANYLDVNKNAGLVFARQFISRVPNQSFEDCPKNEVRSKISYSRLMFFGRYMLGSQSMWRSEIHFTQNIWFNEKYEVAGDYDFALKLSLNYHIAEIKEFLGLYYRDINDRNKEFIDRDRAVIETFEIQRKYLIEFIKSNNNESRKLRSKVKFLLNLPDTLINIFLKAYRAIYKNKDLPSKEFFIWIEAIYCLIENDVNKYSRLLNSAKNNSIYFISLETKLNITNE